MLSYHVVALFLNSYTQEAVSALSLIKTTDPTQATAYVVNLNQTRPQWLRDMVSLISTVHDELPIKVTIQIREGGSGISAEAPTTSTDSEEPLNPNFYFEFTQSIPSSTWVVTHNLGFRPNINVLSSGGVYLLAEVLHIDKNQAYIYFDTPQTGLVTCS